MNTNYNHILLIIGIGLVLMLVVFILVAMLIALLTYEEDHVRDRLEMLKTTKGNAVRIQKKGPFDEISEVLIRFAAPISKNLYGQNQKFQQEVKHLLTEAGQPDSDPYIWKCIAGQVATAILLGLVALVLSFAFTNELSMNAGAFIGGLLIGRMSPMLLLRLKGKKRKDEIRYNLPDALDLMVVCVEAGLGLDSTILRVAEDIESLAPDIAHEFKRVNREMNAGISRAEVFEHLGTRAGVEELKSLCAMIVQSDKLGTSIADTLRIFADDIRVKRRQRAEELAAKASIKMTVPLVFFVFPPLFIVLLGPAVLEATKAFAK